MARDRPRPARREDFGKAALERDQAAFELSQIFW